LSETTFVLSFLLLLEGAAWSGATGFSSLGDDAGSANCG
jgi:hypothetical protein